MSTPITVRETIERSLADEPQTVIKVYETDHLQADLRDYVLTDGLAREFVKVLERVIEPETGGADKVGIWVSGFFGSGKSHFAKLAGHLLADTPVGGETARGIFEQHLHPERAADRRLRELFHQARVSRLECHLVTFDMTAFHAAAAEKNVGLTFLRALYQSLGLSDLVAFAELELEIERAGKREEFLRLYRETSGRDWTEDKDLALRSPGLARCASRLLPDRYATPEEAMAAIGLAMDEAVNQLSINGVVDRILRWLDGWQREVPDRPRRLVFVVDEVGVWAGSQLDRIEQLRALVETLGVKAPGKVWLIATSQEKLSAVVQNAPNLDAGTAARLLERLEARYRTNVHLESSEVGTVIEERILRKRPSSVPALEDLWKRRENQLHDVAESPGLELGATYPRAERGRFVGDYPFLPYQVPAAADIFGGMRGVKVSSGARSMLRVVFDATRELADRPLGAVVSWDQIFDSANRDNEFADEQYLGSQGLTYLAQADRDVPNAPLDPPSRLLKTLWLVQQSNRIPRTPRNLARLLVRDLGEDVFRLEAAVAATLDRLAERDYVRQDVGTGQWRFLSQDEVTVERIVRRLSDEIRQKDLRDAVAKLYEDRLRTPFGRLTVGKNGVAFNYGVFLNGGPLKNEDEPVSLRVCLPGTPAARDAEAAAAANLDAPAVAWVVDEVGRIEERLRRALAIEALESDEDFRRVATERTKIEAKKLLIEASELRSAADAEVEKALDGGTLYYAGQAERIESAPAARGGRKEKPARTVVEDAIRDRILATYYRFADADRAFNPANLEKLLAAPVANRANLDPALALFSPDGHLNGNNVVVEELSRYLKASTRTSGGDVQEHFAEAPFGWPGDLLRYVAAAMFVDGKLSATDRNGRRFDDPRASGARALFGTAPFRTTRLEVEEEALTPAESNEARTLLSELGQPAADGGEIALKDATQRLCTDLTKRLTVVEKAKAVSFPLPVGYDTLGRVLDEISGAASRVKIVRAFLANGPALRAAVEHLKRLEDFAHVNGFEQYDRSRRLLSAAEAAGLADDPQWGDLFRTARDELQTLIDRRQVLDDWNGSFATYRANVINAFGAVYRPLREQLHQRSTAANAAVRAMPEFNQLRLADKATIRYEFLGEGRSLAEVDLPQLQNEQQLLAANGQYSVAHLRAALAALDGELARAKARVIELSQPREPGEGKPPKPPTVVPWNPVTAFRGHRFLTEAEIDDFFDAQKDALKRLVREGKTIQVV